MGHSTLRLLSPGAFVHEANRREGGNDGDAHGENAADEDLGQEVRGIAGADEIRDVARPGASQDILVLASEQPAENRVEVDSGL